MTIAEKEAEFIRDFNELEDWFLQYTYLMDFSKDLDTLGKVEKTEENRVKGCQSLAWLSVETADGAIVIKADSDALLVKGIIGVVAVILHGQKCETVAAWQPRFISETALASQLSADRFKGLVSVIAKIQDAAKSH